MVAIGPAQMIFASVYAGLASLLAPGSYNHPESVAQRVLKSTPLIDLHIDLPVIFRYVYHNDVSNVDYHGPMQGDVDIKRLREGRTGGLFSIAFAPCPKDESGSELRSRPAMGSADNVFLRPNDAVRNTLEQIDVTKQLAKQYPKDVGLANSAHDVRSNFYRHKKLTHLIGIEGAHSLGNSLGTLRTFYDLGVRYLTLTHTCHNVFADTSGSSEGEPAKPFHGGLSDLGRQLVREMNRIGMIVDVSHVADDTARQAIELSSAPIIFSHSGARAIYNHTRNVPDDILAMIGEDSGRDGVVGVTAVPFFVGNNEDLAAIADHADHIAKIAGKSRVAIGTDFDGFLAPRIEGMEDVSQYHNLLAELARRGWTQRELQGLVGDNFLRVFAKVEKARRPHEKADTKPWKLRTDLGSAGYEAVQAALSPK